MHLLSANFWRLTPYILNIFSSPSLKLSSYLSVTSHEKQEATVSSTATCSITHPEPLQCQQTTHPANCKQAAHQTTARWTCSSRNKKVPMTGPKQPSCSFCSLLRGSSKCWFSHCAPHWVHICPLKHHVWGEQEHSLALPAMHLLSSWKLCLTPGSLNCNQRQRWQQTWSATAKSHLSLPAPWKWLCFLFSTF